jgi:hypothetical protein
MRTVRGGQVCINVNGERSAYFKTFRGLRQGDPLSPLLFNLVVDVLGVLLNKAVDKGHLKDILTNLLPGVISHIQYADDTVIMVDGSDQSIRNLKLILYCFEWLTGLKINYHKSEVFVFRVQKEENERLANMLNCVLGKMPMKYLGIPVSNKHLNINAFSSLTQKLHKRLDPWRGKYLTSGGGKFSPIHALVASLYIVWVSTGLSMGCTNKWIVLGLLFCGKVPKISLDTIWQNGKWYLGPMTRVV